MSTSSEYSTIYSIPSVSTYHRIRTGSGLTPFSTEAATRGLPNSLFAVQVMHNDEAIGMGRVIGDGGLFFQVTDIGVLPRYQGQGLGKKIMAEIHQWLKNNVPKGSYVSLMADGRAHELYSQFGFKLVFPASQGMCQVY